MRVFVTGRGGQLALCLAERATAKSGMDITFAGRPQFDLAQPEAARATVIAAAPDVIINTAAYTAVDRAEVEPEVAFAVNREGAAAMAQAAAELGIPLIHISTDYVFSGEKIGPYAEDDATGPRNVYGHSKLAGERAVQMLAPQHVILRTSWVYSVYGQNFVRTMMGLARERTKVSVVADQMGCPTSAHDLAAAILQIAEALPQQRRLRDVLHAAGFGVTTWFDFAAAIFAAMAKHGLPVPQLLAIAAAEYKTGAQRPRNSALDCKKLQDLFGVALPSWETSLDAVVARHLQ